MPTMRVAPDLEMHYRVDDYTDPWNEPEAVLLLHGNNESSAVWFAWVPYLARRYRVIRPDMRGFGDSTAMPRDFPWTLDVVVDDYAKLMTQLGFERFHLIGAKSGGIVARRFAARLPERVRTLTLVGVPPARRDVSKRDRNLAKDFEKHGTGEWLRKTMGERLGSRFPAAGVEWWTALMERTPVSTEIGYRANIPSTDNSADVPRISCPTLVITTEGSSLGSVEQTRDWQRQIPQSTLLVLPGDSFHAAATDADRCAQETFRFISKSESTIQPR